MAVEALASRFNFLHEEKRVKTAAADALLMAVIVRICLDHLSLRDLAQAACVSRIFRGQALLCTARPLTDISYGEIVQAQLSLNRDEIGPWLALVARNGLALQFCHNKFKWRYFYDTQI